MKLSEAIRAGSQGRAQSFGSYFSSVFGDGHTPQEVCALGAALIGCYGADTWPQWNRDDFTARAECELDLNREIRTARIGVCPTGDEDCFPDEEDLTTLRAVVVHLNDDHRWSFERIASWLDDQGY